MVLQAFGALVSFTSRASPTPSYPDRSPFPFFFGGGGIVKKKGPANEMDML